MAPKKYTIIYYYTIGRERLASTLYVETADIKKHVSDNGIDPVIVFEGWPKEVRDV